MATDGDCHYLWKLMAPVQHRWSINDVIGGIRNTVMPSDCSPNIVRNGTIKIGDLSFEEVERFKYLGATVTNINDTREEIKRRKIMGNACYYSVEMLLSSSLLSKNLKVRIYKTVILPVVLYGCETWTLTLREEQRLRVFENKVLRKIFGAKRDEGEWRKLHNAELHALYTSPDKIGNIKSRRLSWAGHVARMGESRNAYRVLVGRPEGKRPLGRPRRRWEDNIKIDLREVGYDEIYHYHPKYCDSRDTISRPAEGGRGRQWLSAINEVARASASWGMCCGVEREERRRPRQRGEVMRLRPRGEIQRIREVPSSRHLSIDREIVLSRNYGLVINTTREGT
ncbi:hypothetical protein ANN_01772 [Periplaneta americana]|uniref:Uncharacterized protein n=1 Tax=Periplaneta americana TaxID=6978 RepID=A0ABQ8TW41_PERAM|nr:hypothetical protein ANN_01772 [Periplaneta americana]